MNAATQPAPVEDTEARRRRVELARRAFKDFHAQCFWSYRQDAEIIEEDIPWIVRELRHNGGHRGYRVAAQLCP